MTEHRALKIKKVLHHRQPGLTVVMENVHDPHNISAILRTCDSVGVQHLYLIDESNEEKVEFGIRSSAGARKWVTVHQFRDRDSCIRSVRANHDLVLATHLNADSVSVYEAQLSGSVAIVFGNEHKGISREMLDLCDGNIIIPQVGMIESLNISVACAIVLYEAFRQRSKKGLYNGHMQLEASEYAQLHDQWTAPKR